ncbi:pyruvate carboxylase [Azospirillum agricola]|uniref:pyruvate carboxylase n=1 Tax=Azospirillum agricola TaxID=1720247 RepID=UPI001AEA3975|nr:pyruvate carboxylase [Azospirillum agricola]MBP2228435.1 pyruvate carboxylase [Azospirillum agricola]
MPTPAFRKLLVANRGEIAIRVLRAATELGIPTVAVYSTEDRFALHRFKADESYRIGEGKGPIEAYLDIDAIIAVALQTGADAIHPGYGFLSENPAFADACAANGITFVGPSPDTMRLLGNKVAARNLAVSAGVPVMPATGALPDDPAETARLAGEVGYPLMLKASWGGGGRGMRVVETAKDLPDLVAAARREAQAAFGNGEVYLEKLVRRARHVEVQILGDAAGNLVHLFERDCTVQRRNQKVVERAPAVYLTTDERLGLCDAALKLARAAGYRNAGTVEFLMDADSGAFYFIEVNPRVQVEHTITEVVTGIDIVKAQIRIAAGALIGGGASGVPEQRDIRLTGHAIQCRITTEDPDNSFIPDYGRITAYRGANGFGIRLDGGTAFSGALITRHYDSLLEKVVSWAPTPEEAIARMDRALREFRIRGVATNLAFLEALIDHPQFRGGTYTTRFIDTTPELFQREPRRDRATRLLTFLADVMVNGNPELKPGAHPRPAEPKAPPVGRVAPPPGLKQTLAAEGAEAVARWMKAQTRTLVTDTSMRDAHQSLLATRVRSHDLLAVAPAYARLLPDLFSVECWGGATFDVAMRFLREDPWERLDGLRAAMPNLLLQMLLRASNAVGYANYPDNVVRHFVQQAAAGGIDVFRVFDSLNWVGNMRVAIDAVRETGALCEAAICYTGDLLDPARPKYDLRYYVSLAKELEAAGAHILGIKDMAGLCKPAAASLLVRTLKEEVGLPIHFHTHDTSGASAASVLAAVEAGVDAVDAAMDSLSGLTSQPPLGSIAAALRHTPRDTGLDAEAIRRIGHYWEEVRAAYAPFESAIRSGSSEVYWHEMPGGQYTNLREQARSLGIEEHHWDDVVRAYATVNRLFGDIVKVTPTSKVVGDMALVMVTGGLSEDDILDPAKEIAFPESVVQLMRGELGQPPGGFPDALQRKVLKGEAPLTVRPGAILPPADLEAERAAVAAKLGLVIDDRQLASHLMYPKVFADFCQHRKTHGDVSVLSTPVFFHGLLQGEETGVELEPGKALLIRYLATGEADEEGRRAVFFELNGQPRTIKVSDRKVAPARAAHPKAEDGNPSHVGAPMPGLVTGILVQPGQAVEAGDALLSLEAMKMETTVRAERAGTVERIVAQQGRNVETKDLLLVLA